MNIKKCILPAQKRFNFLKLSQTQNGKLYFSPMFQVELRNSTFFQQYILFKRIVQRALTLFHFDSDNEASPFLVACYATLHPSLLVCRLVFFWAAALNGLITYPFTHKGNFLLILALLHELPLKTQTPASRLKSQP